MTSTTQLTPLHYETPTVTLEVMAAEAGISQWSETPIVKVWRFQIQIRSSMTADSIIAIRGDRDALMALQQAVQSYIHATLTHSTVAAPAPLPSPLHLDNTPHLEAAGLTRHRLYLGNVVAASGEQTITLGAIQLGDLGTVFDQMESQVRLLPVELVPVQRQRWRSRPLRQWRQWGAIAASTVAAVGLTTTLWSTYQTNREMAETAVEPQLADQEVLPSPPSSRQEAPSRSAEASRPQDILGPNLPDADATDEDIAEASTSDRAEDAVTDIAPAAPTTSTTSPARPKQTRPRPSSSSPREAAPSKPTSEASVTAETSPEAPEPSTITGSQAPTTEPTESALAEAEAPPPLTADSAAPSEPALVPGPTDSISSSEVAMNEGPTDDVATDDRAIAAIPPVTADADESVADEVIEGLAANESVMNEDSLSGPARAPAPVNSDTQRSANASSLSTEADLAALAATIETQWEPPTDLDTPLTYTLQLATDGTLTAIVAEDDIADRYRDRAGLPDLDTQLGLMSERRQIQIRLYPSGDVQVVPVLP